MAQAAASGGAGSIMQNPLWMMLLIFAVFYFLVIRPQSKKAKELQQLLKDLKKGDDVVTQGGVIGRISGLKDDEVTLQVQEGVRLRVLRSSITGMRKVADKPAEKSEKSSESPKDVKAS